MSIRRTALETLTEITDKGAYANLTLKEALRGLEERDAKWVSAAVYTTLGHLLYIDHVIAAYTKGSIKPQIRGILRLGVCQVLYMGVPDSAACNESVKLAKEIGKGQLSGFVNGVMRNICRNKDNPPPLPGEPVKRLSIQYSYPEYLVKEYIGQYGAGFTESMLSAMSDPGCMTVRAQYPYTSEQLEKALEERNIGFSRGRIVEDAFKLEKGFDVTKEPLFTEGRITVQSESAMLVCRALGPQKGMRILDVCAAPGGKSAYMASLTQGGAVIDSWELHTHRAELMKRTFERLGVMANVKVMDGTVRHPELYGKYDAVLIDAPCSGLGVPGKPDARYAKTDAIIDEIAGIQKKLLDACADYVKPGGVLMYATCTISKRENEEQAKAFMERNGCFEKGELSDCLPKDMWKRLYEGFMLQLFPHTDGTEGFFLAKMIRR